MFQGKRKDNTLQCKDFCEAIAVFGKDLQGCNK